ncbi:MAG TPA: hypothetical protein VN026_00570 [Bacteroidia bacterium]|nr:hypothetical protein [Bacteroidia bacterium]
MLYISYCAYKTKKAFKIMDLKKTLSSFNDNYSYGWHIASICMGLVDHESNEDIINITEFDDYLAKIIESTIKKGAKDYDSGKDVAWVAKFSRVKDIVEIENYFGYSPTI